MHVLAAPDKFRGSIPAAEVAEAVAAGAAMARAACERLPVADGGEGTLVAFGGPNRITRVTDALGQPVDAHWRLDGTTAVIESAEAIGLERAGGPDGNDALGATSTGVGELIVAALEAGARRIVVGLGGSATTDGGLGALRAIGSKARLKGAELIVACDVRTRFLDAAAEFAPQKGASRAQAKLLERRLESLAATYEDDYGVDVRRLPFGGAAGGLAGGLHAVGGVLATGFTIVAEAVDLYAKIEAADLVVTGEGTVDLLSFEGKVVGEVVYHATQFGKHVLVIGGQVDPSARIRLEDQNVGVVSLVDRYGDRRAWSDTAGCIADAVATHIGDLGDLGDLAGPAADPAAGR